MEKFKCISVRSAAFNGVESFVVIVIIFVKFKHSLSTEGH